MTKKNEIPFQVRQGDVLVEAVDHIPASATVPVPKEGGRVVLAHGEVTGHAHAFARSAKVSMLRSDELDRRFFTIAGVKGADLKHEEHAPIPHPPGTYEPIRQVEYTPEAIRTVAD